MFCFCPFPFHCKLVVTQLGQSGGSGINSKLKCMFWSWLLYFLLYGQRVIVYKSSIINHNIIPPCFIWNWWSAENKYGPCHDKYAVNNVVIATCKISLVVAHNYNYTIYCFILPVLADYKDNWLQPRIFICSARSTDSYHFV